MKINAKLVSSLEKCFLDEHIDKYTEITGDTVYKNQRYSFQLAYETPDNLLLYTKLAVESDINELITVKEVVNIPSDMAVYPHSDEDVLRRDAGLYPDLLRPADNAVASKGSTKAYWITVAPEGKAIGKHDITVKLLDAFTGEELCKKTATVDILDIALPEQELVFAQWFHVDCLVDYYGVSAYSDEHFEIIEKFTQKAVEGGRNMIMIPLFAYPLDIHHDGYRTDVQIVDIYKNGDEYTFNFDKLDRLLEIYRRNGVKYYEVEHLFSQWGATSTPAVMAYVEGERKRIFGWDTEATSDAYKVFLRTFLQAFIAHMKELGEDQKCHFHVSDEPVSEHLPQFKAVKAMIADIIEGYHHIDALSHFEFYEQGLINTPVPGTPYIKPFLENGVPDLWCYYCGGQCMGVSNCHFAMSLARTRYIGVQFFKYKIAGFLNWGYNFYNNQWSYDNVDPFLSSTGEMFSASGDTYMVYPAPDGSAWESNRFVAFYEALEDLRAMKLCASLYSHEETVKAIEEITGEIVFDKCICDGDTMLKVRHRIDQMIIDKLGR